MNIYKIVFGSVLLVFSAASVGETEIKGTPSELREFIHPAENIVVIRGYSEKKAFSDKAIVSLVITTESKKLSSSIQRNQKLRSSIKTKLIGAGIKEDEINNSKFSTSPQYGWFGKEPDSYKVVNRMDIGIYDEKQLIIIATVSDENMEVVLAGSTYDHTQKVKYKDLVKERALSEIMKQKKSYEKTLGVKLIPTGISDTRVHHMPTKGAMLLEQAVTKRKQSAGYTSKTQHNTTQSNSSFDEVKYEANMVVEFEIIRDGE